METTSHGPLGIGEAARLFAVRTSALRFYEELGLLVPARRGRARVYTDRDLQRIELILMWRHAGHMTLEDIGTALEQSWRDVVERRKRAVCEDNEPLRSGAAYLRRLLMYENDEPLLQCPYLQREIDALYGIESNQPHVEIGTVAEKVGIRSSAIRFYEQEGLLASVRRRGRRCYGANECRRLAFIVLCRRLGQMSLEDLRALTGEGGTRQDGWRACVRARANALEEQLSSNESAVRYLEYILTCPSDDIVKECPYIAADLNHNLRERQNRIHAHGDSASAPFVAAWGASP